MGSIGVRIRLGNEGVRKGAFWRWEMSLIEREYSRPEGEPQPNYVAQMANDLIVTMQAAWIEWQHGRGAEAAMEWIQNTLVGPGQIPDEDDPYGTDAQSWHGLHRSDKAPPCSHCGKPAVEWGQDEATCGECRERKRLGILHPADGPAAQPGGKS